jgi:hypothetical protein
LAVDQIAFVRVLCGVFEKVTLDVGAMIESRLDQDGIGVDGNQSDSDFVGSGLIPDDIDRAISEIKSWFLDDWGRASGLPAFLVGEDGQPIGGMDLLTDLADYLPQLYLAGGGDYVRGQIDLAVEVFKREQVILTPRERRGFFSLWRRANPFYSTDFLLGFVILHRLDQALVPLDRLRDIAYSILGMYNRNGWMVKEVVYPFRWRVPLSESDSLLFVEMWVELYRLTSDGMFLDAAEDLARRWLDHPLTQNHGVVPQLAILSPKWRRIPRFSGREAVAVLYKHNTGFLTGLMALTQLEEDRWRPAAIRATDGICQHFMDDNGRVFFRFESMGSEMQRTGVSLGNSVVIEPLLDMFQLFGRDQDLSRAKSVAEYWISLQDPDTGLVPNDQGDLRSEMDHQTDFAVNLHRLYVVTGNRQYLDTVLRIVSGQLRHHRKAYGYVNAVHGKTGAVIDGTVETRYTSLFLKILLLLKLGKSAWDNPDIGWVLKDR